MALERRGFNLIFDGATPGRLHSASVFFDRFSAAARTAYNFSRQFSTPFAFAVCVNAMQV
jgi:hypothetical protein